MENVKKTKLVFRGRHIALRSIDEKFSEDAIRKAFKATDVPIGFWDVYNGINAVLLRIELGI